MVCSQTEMLLSEIYWFNKNDRTFVLLGPKHRNMNCITTVTTTSTSRTPLLKDQQQTKTTEKTIWSIKVKVARLFLQKKGQEKAWHYMCATKWKGKELKQMTEARSEKEQEGMRGMNSKKVSRVDKTKGNRRNGKRKEKEKWEWKKKNGKGWDGTRMMDGRKVPYFLTTTPTYGSWMFGVLFENYVLHFRPLGSLLPCVKGSRASLLHKDNIHCLIKENY